MYNYKVLHKNIRPDLTISPCQSNLAKALVYYLFKSLPVQHIWLLCCWCTLKTQHRTTKNNAFLGTATDF